jgi:hypothetical protein
LATGVYVKVLSVSTNVPCAGSCTTLTRPLPKPPEAEMPAEIGDTAAARQEKRYLERPIN